MAALISKPGLTSASTLSIPQEWDPTWFRKLIQNQLKGGDVRNAVGSGGIVVSGNLASPYATIGFGAPVSLPGPVTITTPTTAVTALTVNAASGAAPSGITVNVFNTSTDALILNGITGTIGPDINFELSGTPKAFIGVASKANEGFLGAVAGDTYLRTQGGRLVGTIDGNATTFDIYATGTFTGTLTGMTATITGTMTWVKTGNIVCVYSPTSMTGISNAVTMTMTGVPAAIQPAATQLVACSIEDNANNAPGMVQLSSGSGTWTFYRSVVSGTVVNYISNLFTNAGTKGLNGISFAYSLR